MGGEDALIGGEIYNYLSVGGFNIIVLGFWREMDKNTVYDWMFPFVIGGFSGALATCMIQPLDTLKVQMQIVSERLGKSRSDGLAIINVFYKIKS